MNEQPPETGNTSVMRLLTSVKNSDSGFKKASKNIQVGNMKMISLKDIEILKSFLFILIALYFKPESRTDWRE